MTGHRQRMIKKFLLSSENFSDIDLLELLLFFTIPRRDTRPIAKHLLLNHNCLISFLAETVKFTNLTTNTKTFLHLIYLLTIKLSEKKILNETSFSSRSELIEYFRLKITWKNHEELYVIFLNCKNNITQIEMLFKGTVNSIHVDTREIIKKSIDYRATSIILIHNHPSGDSTPSRYDIDFTSKIKSILLNIDVSILDHFIITQTNYFSFADHNLL